MWSVGHIVAATGEENTETLEVERIETVRMLLLLFHSCILPFITDCRCFQRNNGLVTGPWTNTACPEVGEQSEQLLFRHVGSDANPEKWVKVLWHVAFIYRQTLETFGTVVSFFVFGFTWRRFVFQLLWKVQHLGQVSAHWSVSPGFRL